GAPECEVEVRYRGNEAFRVGVASLDGNDKGILERSSDLR
ncbi:hypothetical protein A2U01_0104688, partial [Trifolium medium]|nr:hypothetical protein [Trifolium medium]